MGSVYTIGPAKSTSVVRHTLRRVTRREPCPICADIAWCELRDDGAVHCMRTESDKPCEARMGGWWHNLPDWRAITGPRREPKSPHKQEPIPLASLEDRHRVYSDLLNACQLGAVHEAWLLAQGIDQPAGFYATLNGNRAEVCRHLMRTYPQELLITVPGLWIHDDGTLGIAAMDGLLVAVRGIDGRIERLQCRVEQDGKKAYHWLSSSSHGGPSSGAIPHYADAPDKRRIYITEGVKKAEICALLTGHPCIGMASHSGYMLALEMVKRLDIDSVVAALDEDAKPETAGLVDKSRQELVQQALAQGLAVRVARWPHEQGKGIDDLLLAGYQPTITRIVPDKRGVAPLYSINGTEARAVATVAVLHAEGEFQTVDKLIAIERIWLSKDPPGPDARPEPLYLPSLAKRIGASANRISKGLKHLSRQGLAKHQSRFDDTTKRKHIEFAPTIGDCTPIRLEPLPHVITDRELARCRDCGSSDLVRNTRILCRHCGAIQSERPSL